MPSKEEEEKKKNKNKCQDCEWYKTVWELFSTNFKFLDLEVECSNKLPTLNKAMAHLRSYAFPLPWFKKSERVDVHSVSHETCDRIYMPIWFFGKWCTNCMDKDDQCDECCMDWFGKLKMLYKDSVPQIGNSQYTINCHMDNKVKYSFPTWVNKAYFMYYRYFNKLEDEDSIVPIPDYLEPALDLLLQYYAPTTDPADKVWLWEDFTQYINQLYQTFKYSGQMQKRIKPILFR